MKQIADWLLKRVQFNINKMEKKNRKNITHIIIFCFLLFHYQVWIFASSVVHVMKGVFVVDSVEIAL